MLLLLFIAACSASGASLTNDFLQIVRRYADTMIEQGRDTYGPQHSGLLLSALDRGTLSPLTVRPAAPEVWLPTGATLFWIIFGLVFIVSVVQRRRGRRGRLWWLAGGGWSGGGWGGGGGGWGGGGGGFGGFGGGGGFSGGGAGGRF